MHHSRITLAALTLMASAAAQAGLHSICYEGPTRVKLNGISPTTVAQETLTVVVGCIDDSGAKCTITPMGADLPWGVNPTSLPWDSEWQAAARSIDTVGEFAFFQYAQSNTPFTARATRLRAKITFDGGQTHDCEVTPRGYIGAPWAVNGAVDYIGHPEGVLTGFTTDASGKLTTGVWRASQDGSVARARVPADFIAVGGGALAADGAFIERSNFSDTSDALRGWEVRSFGSSNSTLIKPTGPTSSYVIGLRIQGLPANLHPLIPDGSSSRPSMVPDLRAQVGRAQASSLQLAAGQMQPTWSVSLPSGASVALGGGLDATATSTPRNSTGRGVFALGNHPVDSLRALRCALVQQPCTPPQADGWRAEAVSEWGYYEGDINVRQAFLPAKIVVQGTVWEVRGRMVSASAKLAQGGSQVQAQGLRGAYAVVGVGGSVNWRPFTRWGNEVNTWLARVEPRLDLGGAAVESRAGAVPGLSSLTAYALGIRLVPEGTPADVEEPPPMVTIDHAWLCTVYPLLGESSACRGDIKLSQASEFCKQFPDMPKYGLCAK